MGDYNRTIWKDHIKDQNGNVIQQGTPVSAKNLNNIENQIVSLSAKENILAELVRESIPSGFTTLSDLNFTTMSITPNTIKLLKDSVAYVNGYKITIPSGTTITLDAPPTSGIREDLVFLEVWKQADANGAEQLNWRIRVVNGVDFSAYPDGLASQSARGTLFAQGANASPLTTNAYYNFAPANSAFSYPVKDSGLYIAGNYNDLIASKTALGTTDGYVYAIPMFRVKRRNSGGYSVINGNGALPLVEMIYDRTATTRGNFAQWTASNQATYDSLIVGSYYTSIPGSIFKIISKDGSLKFTVLALSDFGAGNGIRGYYRFDRNDRLFADIIAERDVTDIRHQVSLTGFNNQQLLEESFDKLSRGELQTTAKTSMLKTYHGIPKTPIDSNHVFYASLDGTTVAEVGGSLNLGTGSFKPMPTGLGYKFNGTDNGFVRIDAMSNFSGTFEFFIPPEDIKADMQWATPLSIYDNAYKQVLTMVCPNSGNIYVSEFYNDDSVISTPTVNIANYLKLHIRVSWDATNIYVRINGKLMSTTARKSNAMWRSPTLIKLGGYGGSINLSKSTLSDLSLSNIDRGGIYASLPQDFIDGYARISNAFNTQRNIFSDALTSESPLVQVKCAGSNNKEITLGDSTDWIKDDGTKWNTGDRIKVKGLGGEIITGVIDADTALAKITSVVSGLGTTTAVVTLDNVSGLIVGDIYNVITNSGTISVATWTVTAINGLQVTFTVSIALNSSDSYSGGFIVETTASSSAPTVKANLTGTAQAGAASTITLPSTFSATDNAYNGLTITIIGGTGAGQVRTISGYVGSTKVATVSAWATNPDATSTFLITGVPVQGTWSGLGTNEVIFTLSANSGLVAQDLWINYSLNEVPGQGGIPEVLTATLAGESNGKKLVVNPITHIMDDYAGKLVGSMAECPNRAAYYANSSLLAPSLTAFEFSQALYDTLKTLNGYYSAATANTNGQIPQQPFSFNIIRMIEDKYGKLPCADDTASKVAWLKANLGMISFNWWGYGSCPGGNKAVISGFRASNNAWNYFNYAVNTNIPSLVVCSTTDSSVISSMIDSNGFVHFLAYTDASDGITPSAVYTDYCVLKIALITPTGYDVLAPENQRRDDGKGNMLLVRKETKEIQTLFTKSNIDGVVTYGDYVPSQLLPYNATSILYELPYLICTTVGTGARGTMDSLNAYCNKSVFGQSMGIPNMYNFKNEILFDTNVVRLFNNGNKQNYSSFSKTFGWGMDSYTIILDPSIKNRNVNLLVLDVALINYNNELYIGIIGHTRIINSDGSTSAVTLSGNSSSGNVPVGIIKLNKRPLIK